jgi:GntR family transcriptional regulator
MTGSESPPGAGSVSKRAYLVSELLDLAQALPTGAAIPSERDLAARYGVSRMTLRQAIEDLVRDGYLIRRHGAGTFVGKPRIAKQFSITSFSEDMKARGLTASSRVLSIRRGPAGARMGSRLKVSPDEVVLVVARLRLADGEPMALEWLHVPDRLVPGLTTADLERQSFYHLLADNYGIAIDGGHQTIEPTVTDQEESRLLGVALHSPALFVERVAWTADHEPVEFTLSLYRGDRYKFAVDLTRPSIRPRVG